MSRCLVLVLLTAALAGCGGGDGAEGRAKEVYAGYRTAQVDRTAEERRLNRSFRALASAAGKHDRAGVLAASRRAQAAATTIHELFEEQLAAAKALQEFDKTTAAAGDLVQALRTTRRGLVLIEEELAIALRDPFLEQRRNSDRVHTLAQRSATLSVRGGVAVRRADRAVAEALGVEARFDPMFDLRPDEE